MSARGSTALFVIIGAALSTVIGASSGVQFGLWGAAIGMLWTVSRAKKAAPPPKG